MTRWLKSLWAAALALALPLVGCQSPCAQCSGCCDLGECRSGSSQSACGRWGAACVACGAGQVCDLGSCVAALDSGVVGPTVCRCNSGCCEADGRCVVGNLPASCGLPGRFCRSCDAGLSCPAGSCVDMSKCTGCLDALGVCRSGLSATSCGVGGAPCQGCIGTDQCTAGRCVGTSTCSAANCPAGCCANVNTCVPPSSSQCGTRGSVCLACPDAGSCVAGVCQ